MTDKKQNTASKYGKIVEHLKTQMANTDGKWQMPWDCGICQPTNAKTQHKYTATNRLILGIDAMLKGKQAIYATFNQWKDINCQVKKGAKSTPILMPLQRKKLIEKDDGTEETQYFISGFKILNVFHYSDVDGYTAPTPQQNNDFTDIQHLESFIARTGAIIKPNTKAFYAPDLDYIAMPPKQAFFNTNTTTMEQGYYSTLLHELTHWTGAKHRLNREIKNEFATEKYAFEELVAELGAVFASQDLGLEKQPRPDHALYLKNWISMLDDSPELFFKASTQAERAIDYLNTAPTEHPPIKAVAFNSATQTSLF